MKISRSTLRAVAVVAALVGGTSLLSAQGVTTGAIAGQVTDEAGRPLSEVQIVIKNVASGFQTGSFTRNDGRYRVQNLESGGPYTVTARRIGLQARTESNQIVPLAQTLVIDFKLTTAAAQLAGVQIVATATPDVFTPSNQGTKTLVSDTVIQRMPTLTRNLTDFIRLTPQASATGAGFSGGGMSNRMNNVQIDGASERDVFGLGATGQPGAEVNAKSVSIEAVKEFQVLLAPFDVRQGNFGGLLLNAVTKGGTNDWHGSVFHYFRNQDYGADTPAVRGTKFNRAQTGFSLGGPIIRDKLHFFVAPEFQKENSPVTGPYLSQPTSFAQKFPIQPETIARFESIMASLGDKSLGSSGYINVPNPLSNVFGRLDYQINDANRLVFRYNYSKGERLRLQNNRGTTTAVYSDNFHNFVNVKNAPVAQLFSNFNSGASNELFVGYNNWYNRRTPLSLFPQITINNVSANGPNGNSRIIAGADQFSQGNELDTKTWEVTENFTFRPMGKHTITVGTRGEYVWLRNLFTQSSYGVWGFRNLDSLAAKNPASFRKAIILSNGGNVYFSALQNAFYAQDQWEPTSRLSVTAGMRFDLSTFLKDIPYNAAIDSAYGRRTDDIPKRSLQFSPRLGFNWDVTGDQHNQVRGGVGLFVGTPPYVWLENAYVNSGNVITFLNCTNAATPAPAFNVDPSGINTCRNGAGSKPIGDVNFMAKDLKFPQPFRASLAYDRQLPWNLVGSLEGLFSKTLNQLFFVSKNLQGVTGTGQGGRVLYMNAVNPGTGASTVILPTAVVANGGQARFSTAIDLQNQSKDFAYNLTAQLRRRFINNWESTISYTYSRARDVQSFGSSTAISNWQFGRTLSGRQEDAFTTTSLFDQPHKFLAVVTRTIEWKRGWGTDATIIYTGTSGAPHDYIYGGTNPVGDLNGDGVQGNDLIYVPKNALDPAEIQFRVSGTRTTAVQAQDLEDFIKNSPCLSSQRGQILARNSCRNPFTNIVDLSVRQNIPTIRGERFAIDLDIFNFGNLLNKNWGKQPVTPTTLNSNVPLMTHVGYSSTDPKTAVPIVTFNPPAGGEYVPSSNFSGNFWRTQVSLRYSF